MRKTLWIMLALLVVGGAPVAHADIVTLDVSASLTHGSGIASCSASGCTLGGNIVIDNTTGAIISEDVTMSGESPSVGPFTQPFGRGIVFGLTQVRIADSAGNLLNLVFSTPTEGSLVGYTGGPLSNHGDVFAGSLCTNCLWLFSEGALTPAVTPAPEPSSVALMLLGVGFVIVMRKRIGEGVAQAS